VGKKRRPWEGTRPFPYCVGSGSTMTTTTANTHAVFRSSRRGALPPCLPFGRAGDADGHHSLWHWKHRYGSGPSPGPWGQPPIIITSQGGPRDSSPHHHWDYKLCKTIDYRVVCTVLSVFTGMRTPTRFDGAGAEYSMISYIWVLAGRMSPTWHDEMYLMLSQSSPLTSESAPVL
jgi:hypothetical protein